MKEIRDLMGRMLDEGGVQGLKEVVRLKSAWSDIVGERLAEKTSPYKLYDRRLYVAAESHAWIQELHYQVENIKRQVKEGFDLDIEEVIIKKLNVK
jgi:predicted nucleic acid-binding Zn ribbon protein